MYMIVLETINQGTREHRWRYGCNNVCGNLGLMLSGFNVHKIRLYFLIIFVKGRIISSNYFNSPFITAALDIMVGEFHKLKFNAFSVNTTQLIVIKSPQTQIYLFFIIAIHLYNILNCVLQIGIYVKIQQ